MRQDTFGKYVCCLYFVTTVFMTVGFGEGYFRPDLPCVPRLFVT